MGLYRFHQRGAISLAVSTLEALRPLAGTRRDQQGWEEIAKALYAEAEMTAPNLRAITLSNSPLASRLQYV